MNQNHGDLLLPLKKSEPDEESNKVQDECTSKRIKLPCLNDNDLRDNA